MKKIILFLATALCLSGMAFAQLNYACIDCREVFRLTGEGEIEEVAL